MRTADQADESLTPPSTAAPAEAKVGARCGRWRVRAMRAVGDAGAGGACVSQTMKAAPTGDEEWTMYSGELRVRSARARCGPLVHAPMCVRVC